MREHSGTSGTIVQESSDINGTDIQARGDADETTVREHGNADEAFTQGRSDSGEMGTWEVADVSYLFSGREFAIMAVAVGMTSVYGFDMGMDAPERDDVLETVMQLVQKGMLVRKGDGFCPAEPYEGMFEALRDSMEVLTIRHSSPKLPPKCVYIGTETWMADTDPYAPSRIRCRKIAKNEIAQILHAQEYLPRLLREQYEDGGDVPSDTGMGMYTEEEVRTWDEWEPSGELMDADVHFFNPECRLVMEMGRKMGGEYLPARQLCVLRKPDGYYMEVYEDGRRRCVPYDFERFCREAEVL